MKDLRTLEEKNIIALEEEMPDRRVRPSALTPLGNIFGIASAATTFVLGKEYSNILLYSAEKGIMVRNYEKFKYSQSRMKLMNI
jgi:demethoxyubiquinone hydroxylase (CLK1/Coq7/Cat5 family)